ncbi:MAG: methyltransferase domain-containing protein [Candidatus Methanoperedens sp.]|nr:methyltransferase domain-containing protein [Candidatus Methanoperedens sp.]
MNFIPVWQYNEMQQVGTDYTDDANVEAYDRRMQRLRDIKEETQNIISSINVIAIDVSTKMLEFAKQKAKLKGVTNVEFYHAGFLTYMHSGKPLDAVVSQLALHHIPDFWKIIALKRVFEILKPGGKFYLKDTVYSFEVDNYENFFNNLIDEVRIAAGFEFASDLEIAVREEYATLHWIMEDLLRKAGFHIDKADYYEGFMADYVCTRLNTG